jgi:hypothetical protein
MRRDHFTGGAIVMSLWQAGLTALVYLKHLIPLPVRKTGADSTARNN